MIINSRFLDACKQSFFEMIVTEEERNGGARRGMWGVEEQFLICLMMPETGMYLNTAREDPIMRLKLQGKKK